MGDSTYSPSTYDSSLYESSSMSSTTDPATTLLVFGILGFVVVVSYVISAIFMGMMFKKAGIEAWKAWVPVYNYWTFLEMGGQQGWLSLLIVASFIPFIGWIPGIVLTVFLCIAAYRIGLGFGKESWFVLLYIFLTFVWLIWLAVDKTAVWKPTSGGAVNHQTPPATPPAAPPSQPAAM